MVIYQLRLSFDKIFLGVKSRLKFFPHGSRFSLRGGGGRVRDVCLCSVYLAEVNKIFIRSNVMISELTNTHTN